MLLLPAIPPAVVGLLLGGFFPFGAIFCACELGLSGAFVDTDLAEVVAVWGFKLGAT